MNADHWRKRWVEGQTGWHASTVNDRLSVHWPTLGLKAGASVLVPLCGKSLDLTYLAAEGHQVTGIDASDVACQEFLAEHSVAVGPETVRGAQRYSSGPYRFYCGDIFQPWARELSGFEAYYDRAALIALTPAQRPLYARWVAASLLSGARGLLLTIEYPEGERTGAPHSVQQDEVALLFAEHFEIVCLAREDVLDRDPKFKAWGLSSLVECAYALRKK